jgi:glycosyltransferase involved in cell wall biosynthesis
VIIPVKDRRETLSRCLASIKQSRFPEYEVIVVDDCSRQDCSGSVAKFGFRTVRLNQHQGAWYARNKGAEGSKGDILVFLDGDMLIQPDTLFRIHQHFSKDFYDAVSGVCGRKTETGSVVTRYKNLWMYHSYMQSPRDSDWFICGMGAVRREVFFELKGFDAGFLTGRGGGDLEFGGRLKAAGKKILLDKELEVIHLQRYTWWGLLRNDFKRSRGWFKLAVQKKMLSRVVKKLRIANIYPAFLFSILISVILLVSLFLSFFNEHFIILTGFSALAYLIVNFSLFRFFRKEGGTFFLIIAIPLCWVDHLISGLGVFAGAIDYLGQSAIKMFLKFGSFGYLRKHYHRLINGGNCN